MAGGAAGGVVPGVLISRAILERQMATEEAIKKSLGTWQELAQKRGLTLGGSETSPSLSGSIDGVECSVDLGSDRLGGVHTRVTATAPKPQDSTVGVYPNPGGALAFLKSLVEQDVVVGDEPFDEAFVIRTHPLSAAPALLGRTLRDYLSAMASRGFTAFTYESGRVVLQLSGVETDPEWLGAALDLVIEAARWDPPA